MLIQNTRQILLIFFLKIQNFIYRFFHLIDFNEKIDYFFAIITMEKLKISEILERTSYFLTAVIKSEVFIWMIANENIEQHY